MLPVIKIPPLWQSFKSLAIFKGLVCLVFGKVRNSIMAKQQLGKISLL